MFSSPDHWRSHKPGSVVSLFNTNTSVTFTQIELKKTKCQKKSSFVLKQCFWCELIKTSDFPRVLAVMEVPGQKRIHRWHESDWTDMWSQNLRRLWMVQKGTAVYFYWSVIRDTWSVVRLQWKHRPRVTFSFSIWPFDPLFIVCFRSEI